MSILLGIEGSAGWPEAISPAYSAYPFQCARVSDGYPATMGNAIAEHSRRGVDVMLLVEDWQTAPSTVVATVQRYPAITAVEWGNEDSYSYKNSNDPAIMRTKAGNYALAVKAAREALDAAGLTSVKLIAQNDNAQWQGSTWCDAMYRAVPNFHTYVSAFTVHPYSAGIEVNRVTTQISYATANGCPSNFPIWITEYGVSTSNGTAFSDDNYGHPRNLTWAQAGSIIRNTITNFATYCPSVQRLFYYQLIDSGSDATLREHNFGVIKRDFSVKTGVASALSSMIGFVPGGQPVAGARTGTSDALSQSTRSLVLNRPTGAAIGDATLILVCSNTSAPVIPSGVGLNVLRSGGGSGALFYWLGWRVDDAAASITFTFTLTDVAAFAGAISYRGLDPTTPFVAGAMGAGTGLTWTAPSITTSVDNALAVLLSSYNWPTTSVTYPGGYSTVTLGGNNSVYYGERAITPPAAVPAGVITATSAQTTELWVATLVAANPAPVVANSGYPAVVSIGSDPAVKFF